ncbi:MAG: diaminopimelate decarboxylase [Pyrinomonadaceae bacterium]|nr:diaminopimelate decarboxylase [Pyrinomonadaceae bacterium]MBP6211793.1 diaminopimelate decarboxylase [Pyrinomonadaceae bacterium]
MPQPWEIENFLDVRDGQMHIDGVSAVELAREYGTPLFVYSESRIRHNLSRVKLAAKVIDCPLKICYAAKAMSTMGILRVIKDAGSDIEVNSGGELWKALEVGFTGNQIIFNGTSKEVWELEAAINADIYAIQVDSLYELSLIEKTAERLGKRANVSLRLVPEIETGTHSGLQTALLTSKFGMMPDEAFAAFHQYKDSAHLDLCGVHLHIGSQNPEATPYSQAFAMLFESMLRIYRETGIRLKHINLGGGFPVNYLRDSSMVEAIPAEQRAMFQADFEPIDAIRDAWDTVRAAAKAAGAINLLDGLTLLLEPGRSIISDAAICLTTVRNHKSRPIQSSGTNDVRAEAGLEHWLMTDAGFNILLSMATYKWYYQLISAARTSEPHDSAYKVAGPLCDGGDVYFDIEGEDRLPDRRLLPANIRPGEVLALLNCGAYSLAQGSQYNGRGLPSVILITADGEAKLIRRRDEFSDLVAQDIY